jgi:putative nucleotidyltransferase with HDIG domain
MRRIKAPPIAKDFSVPLLNAGKRAYLVGGAPRDMLMGEEPSDFDIATDALPEDVMRLYRKAIPTGIEHGTVSVFWKGVKFEVSSFRSDGDYLDGRHPNTVRFGVSLEDDLKRRDFTMNALALDLASGEIVDIHQGAMDIRKGIIRAIGDPLERFDEDGLRLLRAARFRAQLGFEIEASTLAGMKSRAERIRSVALERQRDEFSKLVLAKNAVLGMRALEETGLLSIIMPELAACRGVAQKGMHRYDVLDHLLYSMEGAPARIELRLAALLHDIGKPASMRSGEGGEPSFHGHEKVSAEIADSLLCRFRFPTAVRKRVCHLIRQHMFHYEESWTDAALRRFLARVGRENLRDLFDLRRADHYGTTGGHGADGALVLLLKRIEALDAAGAAIRVSDLAIGGDDLAAIGIGRGPVMGRILKELLEAVMDDPGLNEHGRLLEIAARIYAEKYQGSDA